MECAVCKIKLNRRYDDYIECCECSSSSHLKCVNMEIKEFHKMVEDKSVKNWFCNGCSANITSASQDNNKSNLSVIESDDETGAPCISEATIDGGGGGPLDVAVNLLLGKMDALIQSSEKPCCCSKLISKLIDDNLKLRKAIESQAILVESLQSEVHAYIVSSQKVYGSINNVETKQTQKMSAPGSIQPVSASSLAGERARQEKVSPADSANSTAQGIEARSGKKASVGSPKGAEPAVTDNLNGCKNAVQDDVTHTNNQPWTSVVRKAKRWRNNMRDPVVGELQTDKAKLRAVPRRAFIHVTRLHPQTTCEDVVESLKKDLSGVVCERLQSRFPGSYASFKVTINQSDFDKAMDPLLWPEGSLVRQFFQKRRIKVAET